MISWGKFLNNCCNIHMRNQHNLKTTYPVSVTVLSPVSFNLKIVHYTISCFIQGNWWHHVSKRSLACYSQIFKELWSYYCHNKSSQDLYTLLHQHSFIHMYFHHTYTTCFVSFIIQRKSLVLSRLKATKLFMTLYTYILIQYDVKDLENRSMVSSC